MTVACRQFVLSNAETRVATPAAKVDLAQPPPEGSRPPPAHLGVMTSAASRLLREVRDISSQQIPVVFGEPEEADILHWRGMILGPPHTPYALGMFHFDLKFLRSSHRQDYLYPNSPPAGGASATPVGRFQLVFRPTLTGPGWPETLTAVYSPSRPPVH